MIQAANPYVKQICLETGERSQTAAIAAFVRTRRSANESLHALAGRLGVTNIIEEPLQFEGGVFEKAPGALIIKLNSKSPFVRRRFTLAHEVAHLLLGKPGLRSASRDNPALERTCDSIASELLMPLDDVSGFVGNLGQPSPKKLQTIASRYAVSVRTAAIRVHADLSLWKCFVGLWERYPEVKTSWFVGRRRWDRTEPSSTSLDAALASDASVRLTEVWQRGPSAVTVWLNLQRTTGDRVLGLIAFVN